jgi:lipopolysaccharide assembly LptE-like protein
VTVRLVGLLTLVMAGCGYHLSGTGVGIPSGVRSISIAEFGNHTPEAGLEVTLRRAIEEEFRRRGALDVVPDPRGDLVLSGVIRRYQTTPVASVGSSEAVQFQGILQISFRLKERASGRVIYENRLLQESLDFGATSDTVVSTSPRFQRGTVDARDLAIMTSIQVGEGRRRQTLIELADVLARDVYLQSMEGF